MSGFMKNVMGGMGGAGGSGKDSSVGKMVGEKVGAVVEGTINKALSGGGEKKAGAKVESGGGSKDSKPAGLNVDSKPAGLNVDSKPAGLNVEDFLSFDDENGKK